MNETRNRLLDAARACIRDKGLAGATSRDITAEAGANLAAITYHFGSKDQLVAEALVDALRAWLAPALAVMAADTDPAERTLATVQTLITTFEAHRDEAPVYLEALLQSPRLPALRSGLGDLLGSLRQHLAATMIDMRDRGELAAWVDPEAMSSMLIAVAHGLVVESLVDPGGPAVAAMAGQFAHLLLAARSTHALVPRSGAGAPDRGTKAARPRPWPD
ncbi:MAG: TetR/AcrR family transcriptional regulator [Acidimicrobiales bacterium]